MTFLEFFLLYIFSSIYLILKKNINLLTLDLNVFVSNTIKI